MNKEDLEGKKNHRQCIHSETSCEEKNRYRWMYALCIDFKKTLDSKKK